MRHILISLSILFFSFNLHAQLKNDGISKKIVLEKIDKKTHSAVIYDEDIVTESGIIVNGKREGVWQSFNPDGSVAIEASFSKGMKNGIWNIYENSTLKYVIHYQNDSRVYANNIAVAAK
ncbi:MAG: hypothetical protein ISR01_02715 [Chitinophagales bacterium]|nr:hypothetical protein [Chitinophagales bacterium]